MQILDSQQNECKIVNFCRLQYVSVLVVSLQLHKTVFSCMLFCSCVFHDVLSGAGRLLTRDIRTPRTISLSVTSRASAQICLNLGTFTDLTCD